MFNYMAQNQPNNGYYSNIPSRCEIIKVNGENGAKAFQMMPNSSALLLDETNPLVWLVQTDGAGYKSLTPYTITPYEPTPAPDFSSLEARIRSIEERLSNESNNSKPAVKKSANACE